MIMMWRHRHLQWPETGRLPCAALFSQVMLRARPVLIMVRPRATLCTPLPPSR